MDELVKNLMEELNCDTAFTIPIFGGIPVAESVFVTWLIMACDSPVCDFCQKPEGHKPR